MSFISVVCSKWLCIPHPPLRGPSHPPTSLWQTLRTQWVMESALLLESLSRWVGPDSSDCILTLSSPAVKEEYTVGHQLCIQSIQLDTSSAFRVYSWKPAVHSKYTAGKQQCIQSIQLETSSVFKVYSWKPAVCSKYTAGNPQCVQSIQLETSSVFKVYSQKPALHSKYTTRHQQCIQSIQLETSRAETYCSSEPALRECSICRSLPT